MQRHSLLRNSIKRDYQANEPSDLLVLIEAHLRLQEYLADPTISIPYEEFHRRMVAEGLLDE
jgi:hypothetical protein